MKGRVMELNGAGPHVTEIEKLLLEIRDTLRRLEHPIVTDGRLPSMPFESGCDACRRSGICGCINSGPKVIC